MTSLEFWKRLPVTEKLELARSVVSKADSISGTSMNDGMREMKRDLEDLAVKMLEDTVRELKDPGRYS